VAPVLLLADGLMVSVVDALKELLAQEVVLDLLLGVEVHSVVVSREFIPLEELDCCLVQLDDNNLVKQP
jgi:hypothetical protein